MKDELNPFLLGGYVNPQLFCNREAEISRLASNIKNGVNTTLLSIRRMGKTGLIHHLFHRLQKKKVLGIYVDIFPVQNLKEFTNVIATAVMQAIPEKKPMGRRFMEWLRGLHPVISFDHLSGQPEVSFDFRQPRQYEKSLADVFAFLDRQRIQVVMAIDEFQQIAFFPEKNTEALLRSIIQPLKYVRFIFSGSHKHMLAEIFSHSKRPFFSSTQSIHLGPISENEYSRFILGKFMKAKRTLLPDALQFVLAFTMRHTWYTQAVCNRLYSTGEKKITAEFARQCCYKLLKEHEAVFYQYRNLLTSGQWNLLRAIAREEKLYQPSSKSFIRVHDVGTPSNVQRALEALLSKEMVYSEADGHGTYYSVYDCFLARWLETH